MCARVCIRARVRVCRKRKKRRENDKKKLDFSKEKGGAFGQKREQIKIGKAFQFESVKVWTITWQGALSLLYKILEESML